MCCASGKECKLVQQYLPSIWIPRTLSLVPWLCGKSQNDFRTTVYCTSFLSHIALHFFFLSSLPPKMASLHRRCSDSTVLCIIVLKCLVVINTNSSSRRQSPGIQRRELHNLARICKPFKESRNRFPVWRAGTTTLFDVPARQAI